MEPDDLPIVIIGAGPIGLAMAAHLVGCDQRFVILEAGPGIGHADSANGAMFACSPNGTAISTRRRRYFSARRMAARPVGTEIPTGGELLCDYLEPLSELPAIRPQLKLGHRVVAITRKGFDKVKTERRGDSPFLLQARRQRRTTDRSRAVIDASGTWFTTNPLHSSGIWTADELAAAEKIRYGLPNVLGDERERYAGQTTAVVGSGYSAINVILDLAEIRASQPETTIKWVVRRDSIDDLLMGTGHDLAAGAGLARTTPACAGRARRDRGGHLISSLGNSRRL